MPLVRSFISKYYIYIIAIIPSLSKIILLYFYYIKKKLIYIIIVALFGY